MENTVDYRAGARKTMISESYSGVRHAILNFFPLVVVATVALSRVEQFGPGELLMIPLLLLLGNLIVYLVHRHPYHKESLSRRAYAAHTLMHHGFYTDKYPTYDSRRDFFAILLPSWVVFVFAVLYLGPLSWLLPKIVPNDYAQIFIFASAFYLILYETLHLSAHLPEGHVLHRFPWFGYMREFHTTHHDPELMNKYNFGIVFPFWDWMLGSHIRVPDSVPTVKTAKTG